MKSEKKEVKGTKNPQSISNCKMSSIEISRYFCLPIHDLTLDSAASKHITIRYISIMFSSLQINFLLSLMVI